RKEALEADRAGTVYKPLPPARLYLTEDEWRSRIEGGALARLTPFSDADTAALDVGTRQGRNFAPERTEAEANVLDAVTKHLQAPGRFHRRGDQPRCRRPRGACRSRHRPFRRAHHHSGGGRAARLPRTALRRERQALSAGREH